MKEVKDFLLANNFVETEYSNSYATEFKNDKCVVKIMESPRGEKVEQYYIVSNKSGDIMSDNLSIYWLIGVLTYYGFITKDYKQLCDCKPW